MATILVVDDDAQTRGLLREILSSGSYEILEAADGRQGLEIAKKQKIDLIITDRDMPLMNGLEMLKALKDSGRLIPSLMVSGYGEEKMWGDAIAYGAMDYLLKPFKTDDIVKRVKKTLSGGKTK